MAAVVQLFLQLQIGHDFVDHVLRLFVGHRHGGKGERLRLDDSLEESAAAEVFGHVRSIISKAPLLYGCEGCTEKPALKENIGQLVNL